MRSETLDERDSWVAIDFETASVRGTPCSVGLVEVEGRRVVGRHSWLIRPPIFEFWAFNIALHGITPEMCRNAPDWPDSLAEILRIADGRPFVAHNAAFDFGVVRDACDYSQMSWPTANYACTLVIGRRIWPGLSTYSLPFLAAHVGVTSDSHHDAGRDAEMAAGIAVAALDAAAATNLADLRAKTGVMLGVLDSSLWHGCHGIYSKVPPTEPTAGAVVESHHPLFGRVVVFTGELQVPRRIAQQLVVDVGGIAKATVSRHTDYLVTGFQDLSRLVAGTDKSAKLRHAISLYEEGNPVEIISESDFVQILGGDDRGATSGRRLSSGT